MSKHYTPIDSLKYEYTSTYLDTCRIFSCHGARRKKVIPYLQKQIDVIIEMSESFNWSDILVHIFNNPTKHHVNAFTINKWKSAFHIVINDKHL